MIRLRYLVKTAPSSKEIKNLTINDEVTFTPMDNLKDGIGGIDASKKRTLGELLQESYNYFAEGDLLLAKVTPCFENGKKAVATGLINGVGFATSEVHVIRPNRNKIDPNYLRYIFCAEDFRAEGMRSMTGSGGLRRISENAILNYCPRVIDIQSQREIADFLDRETARIDQLIEKKKLLVKILEERNSAMIETYLTKGIKPNVPVFDSGVDWIGIMPSHWQKIPLRSVFRFRNEKNDPIKTEEILSLSIANGITKYTEKGRGGNKRKDDLTAYKLAHKGDIVLNSMNVIVGAVGRSEYFGAISPVYYALYPISEHTFVPYFEKIFLNSGFQKGLLRFGKGILIKISGTGKMNTIRMKVSQHDLKNVGFPLPPEEEQREITKFLDKKLNQSNEIKTLTLRSIDLLNEFRASLITEAVTGQLDIKAWKKRGATDKRLDTIKETMRT